MVRGGRLAVSSAVSVLSPLPVSSRSGTASHAPEPDQRSRAVSLQDRNLVEDEGEGKGGVGSGWARRRARCERGHEHGRADRPSGFFPVPQHPLVMQRIRDAATHQKYRASSRGAVALNAARTAGRRSGAKAAVTVITVPLLTPCSRATHASVQAEKMSIKEVWKVLHVVQGHEEIGQQMATCPTVFREVKHKPPINVSLTGLARPKRRLKVPAGLAGGSTYSQLR